MPVNKRLSLLILSAITLAFMVNLAINSVEISIRLLKPPEGAVIAESSKSAPETIAASVTKAATTSTTVTVTEAPMLMEAARGELKEAEGGIGKLQDQLLSLLLSVSASLVIAASSFLLLKRVLG